jgi:hypothetical protein
MLKYHCTVYLHIWDADAEAVRLLPAEVNFLSLSLILDDTIWLFKLFGNLRPIISAFAFKLLAASHSLLIGRIYLWLKLPLPFPSRVVRAIERERGRRALFTFAASSTSLDHLTNVPKAILSVVLDKLRYMMYLAFWAVLCGLVYLSVGFEKNRINNKWKKPPAKKNKSLTFVLPRGVARRKITAADSVCLGRWEVRC